MNCRMLAILNTKGNAPNPLPSIVACLSAGRRTIRLLMRWRTGSAAICVALTMLGLAQVSSAAEDQQARAIVDRVTRLLISKSCTATVEMQVSKPGLQRHISMRFWSLGEAQILAPPDDAGTAILRSGGDAWMYLPKANRAIAMAPSMTMTSWMGSDFTLNDLVNQSRLTDDYTVAPSFDGQRDGVAVTDYTLTPKPAAPVVWGKIILEVRKADLMPVWQRYYDDEGKLIRELSFFADKTVSGRLIPTRLVMRSLDKPGQQTTITYANILFDAPISEETFSVSNFFAQQNQ
jgi:outer membrane lipoprotein-sorting protein